MLNHKKQRDMELKLYVFVTVRVPRLYWENGINTINWGDLMYSNNKGMILEVIIMFLIMQIYSWLWISIIYTLFYKDP